MNLVNLDSWYTKVITLLKSEFSALFWQFDFTDTETVKTAVQLYEIRAQSLANNSRVEV